MLTGASTLSGGTETEIDAAGEMPLLERNYLDKHDALNVTARALVEQGIPVVAARHLHGD